MRLLRSTLVCLVALAAVVAAPSPVSAAPPASPYDVFTVDAPSTDVFLGPGDADFGAVFSYGNTLDFRADADGPYAPYGSVRMVAPTGGQLAVGSYETQPNYPGPGVAGLGVPDTHCDGPGTLVIHELVWSSPNVVGALAATYEIEAGVNCAGGARGEVRFHSSIGYRATSADAAVLDLGRQPQYGTPVAKSVVITGKGILPVTLGPATITKGDAAAFVKTVDTCSGATLAFGQTCTITVAPNTADLGDNTSEVTLADAEGGNKSIRLRAFIVWPKLLSTGSGSLGDLEVGHTSEVTTMTVTSTGFEPVTIGQLALGAQPAGATYTLVNDTCSGTVLAPEASCQYSVRVTATALGQQSINLAFPNDSQNYSSTWSLWVIAFEKASSYYPVPPQRLLDTRTGVGAPKAPIGPGQTVDLQVTGKAGIPAAATAVVLNVTVTAPTAGGYLTVYPAGVSRPVTSSINFPAAWTGANSVTVRVGANGRVSIFNATGSTQVIADVVGFYTGETTTVQQLGPGGLHHQVTPVRLLDTRSDPEVGKIAGGGKVTLGIDFEAASSHVRAVAVNITAVSPEGTGFLTAWSGSGTRPGTSTLNFTAGKVVPNLAIVPTAPCAFTGCSGVPQIEIYNGSALPVHVLVDIVGYYDDGTLPDGLAFVPRTPKRILDTRTEYLIQQGPIRPGQSIDVPVSDRLTAVGYARGFALNVTAVKPTSTTYLTLWPGGTTRPTVSNLNAVAGQVVANATITHLGPVSQWFSIYNQAGYTDVLVDVVGSFEYANRPPISQPMISGEGSGWAEPTPTTVAVALG
ncbi:MAG: choice-of-anchor D domain-containing protein [Hamadaea sp.]|nr:choice-of-anchor D domain-containing protein [Hamadaea sp.]